MCTSFITNGMMRARSLAKSDSLPACQRGAGAVPSWAIMKITSLLVVCTAALALLVSSFVAVNAADAKKKKTKLRHVVAFKFKESATPDQIKKIEEAFAALPKQIKEVKKFEWGTNNSPEKKNKGCTHAFILTFKNEKDRDNYLVHPAHKEFGNLVGPLLDDVFVIDFWNKEKE